MWNLLLVALLFFFFSLCMCCCFPTDCGSFSHVWFSFSCICHAPSVSKIWISNSRPVHSSACQSRKTPRWCFFFTLSCCNSTRISRRVDKHAWKLKGNPPESRVISGEELCTEVVYTSYNKLLCYCFKYFVTKIISNNTMSKTVVEVHKIHLKVLVEWNWCLYFTCGCTISLIIKIYFLGIHGKTVFGVISSYYFYRWRFANRKRYALHLKLFWY